jgi:starvation-inducible DNA-binding protein
MTSDLHTAANTPGDLQHAQSEAEPKLNAKGVIIQTPNQVRHMPIGLSAEVRYQEATTLNQVLVDTLMLYHLYKKAHWQVAGHTFYQLHLLFDKHAGEQLALVDMVAERVQLLGGIATGMPHDIVEQTNLERAPQGAEQVPMVISRLLAAHERILMECRGLAREAESRGDFGTNDLLVSNVIRTNELQVWFVAEHVVETPSV